ncbi:MAG: hypothetical protein KC636_21860 [Myxococcales bacterium]|nr:hypothetical protein [Myxococcales bacterium]
MIEAAPRQSEGTGRAPRAPGPDGRGGRRPRGQGGPRCDALASPRGRSGAGRSPPASERAALRRGDRRGQGPARHHEPTSEDATTGRGGRRIVCAACRAEITGESARVEVTGSHEHHFVNPHGHDFVIGCFAWAPGLVPAGPATERYSWFPGLPWRVAVCSACRAHLGWSFGVPTAFHGLILARLRVLEDQSDGTG